MAKSTRSSLALIISLISTVQCFGWQAEWGMCPQDPKGIDNFNYQRFLGNWYELYRDKDLWYMPEKNDCQSGRWYYKPEKDYPFWVKYMHLNREDDKVVNTLLGGSEEGTDGVVNRIDLALRDGTGKWYWWILPFVNFIIVDTDYDNYAILYGCNDWGIFHTR